METNMFKKFFTKVGSFIKSIPSKAVKATKAVGTAVVGAAYFCIWLPIACVKMYAELFIGFGEAAIEKAKNFFAKFKKADAECECECAAAEA